MDKKVSTKKVYLLQHGLELISQIGVSGITLGNLADKAGVSKSGLFAHFGSKEELQIALLEHSATIAAQFVVEPALNTEEGLPRLEALIQNWFGWPTRAALPGGCPVAAAMFEMDDIAESPVRNKLAAMESEWHTFLQQQVQKAIELGHFKANLNSEQFVWELCGFYLNHHVSQRFIHNPKATLKAQVAIADLIERSKSK